jgi:AcrR family transcriptional regulator
VTQEAIRDGRRVRGDQSRRTILGHAIDSATVEGLDGLTIGRLAAASGHSKSGVATLFGSREQLQLATIEAARAVFIEHVVTPARAETERGLPRLCALISHWIAYSEERVFRGGCFFAATSVELDARPGVLRDAVIASSSEWEVYLALSIERAMAAGELPLLEDARQLTFEIVSFLEAANTRSLMYESTEPYRRAGTAVRTRLVALGADPVLVERIGAAGAE